MKPGQLKSLLSKAVDEIAAAYPNPEGQLNNIHIIQALLKRAPEEVPKVWLEHGTPGDREFPFDFIDEEGIFYISEKRS